MNSLYKSIQYAGLLSAVLISNNLHAQTTVKVDMSKSYQKIVGMGTHGLPNEAIPLAPAFYRLVVDREYGGDLEESANDNNDVNSTDLSKFKWKSDVISFAKKEYDKPNAPFFIASVFSPPKWMKDMSVSPYTVYNMGGKEVLPWWSPCGADKDPNFRHLCGGKLRTDMYEEFAEWTAGWVKAWKAETGKDLYAISVQNEPEFNEPYGSCVYSAAELALVADKVAKRFQKDGITVKIFHGEILWAQSQVISFFREAIKYPDLMKQLQGFAVHNYDTDGIQVGGASASQWAETYNLANRFNKETWMSETSGFSDDVAGLMTYMGHVYTALYSGNISLWCQFTIAPAPQKDNTLYNAYKVVFMIKPNNVRCDAISNNADILSLGFKDQAKQTMTVLLINRGVKDIEVTLDATTMSGEMDMICTSPTKNAVSIGKFNKAGNYKLTIPAKSIAVGTAAATVPLSTAIENISKNEKTLQIYPNPANDLITVSTQSATVLEITDLRGQVIQENNVEAGATLINISTLSKGLYLIKDKLDGTIVKKLNVQ